MAEPLLVPTIPEEELRFRASRASGPGGQNVNKVSTKVTLELDVTSSPSLSPEQRQRILERLSTRISKAGVLHISSQRHRTQSANRGEVLARLAELLAAAFTDELPRKPTRMPRVMRVRRRESKRKRGEVKRLRGGAGHGEDEP